MWFCTRLPLGLPAAVQRSRIHDQLLVARLHESPHHVEQLFGNRPRVRGLHIRDLDGQAIPVNRDGRLAVRERVRLTPRHRATRKGRRSARSSPSTADTRRTTDTSPTAGSRPSTATRSNQYFAIVLLFLAPLGLPLGLPDSPFCQRGSISLFAIVIVVFSLFILIQLRSF